MLIQLENKNAQFVWNVVLSLLMFGATWAVSNQSAVIAAGAILIVYALNMVAKTFHVQLGRAWLTVILYVVSLAFAFFMNPVGLPAFAVETSDPALFVSGLLTYLATLITALSPYAGVAMGIYNVLLKDVLDRLAVGVLSVTQN